MVSDLTDMDRNPYPVDASKVRRVTLTLPDDVYFEYAFLDQEGAMRADPENEVRAENPWYPEVSAVFGPAYTPGPYRQLEPSEPQITRERFHSAYLGASRRVLLHTPQGYEGETLPCLLVQDGPAYLRIGKLPAVLEALLRDGLVEPVHVAFVEPKDRAKEYTYHRDYQAFIRDELIPFVAQELPVSDEWWALGASLGGLVSARVGLEQAALFRGVIAQSGAFLGTPEEPDVYRSEQSWLAEQLEQGKGRELRWVLSCGTLEWLTDVNRRVARALEQGGYDQSYRERNAGHNWVNWRDELAPLLRVALEKP